MLNAGQFPRNVSCDLKMRAQNFPPFLCVFQDVGKGGLSLIDTEYDRAKVPPYNGSDPTSRLERYMPLGFQTY